MKALLVCLALAACSSSPATYEPDAGTTPDAAPVRENGCAMGNLPLARTDTFTTADPIPPAILNELQDMVMLGAMGNTLYFIGAADFCLETGTGTLAAGIWTIANTGTNRLSMAIRLPVGTTIEDVSFFVGDAGGAAGSALLRKRSMNDGGITNQTIGNTFGTVGPGTTGSLAIGGTGTLSLPTVVTTLFSYTLEITFSGVQPSTPTLLGVGIQLFKDA